MNRSIGLRDQESPSTTGGSVFFTGRKAQSPAEEVPLPPSCRSPGQGKPWSIQPLNTPISAAVNLLSFFPGGMTSLPRAATA